MAELPPGHPFLPGYKGILAAAAAARRPYNTPPSPSNVRAATARKKVREKAALEAVARARGAAP